MRKSVGNAEELSQVVNVSTGSISPLIRQAVLRVMNGVSEPGDDELLDKINNSSSQNNIKQTVLDEEFFN